jgi:hypothetical protein
MALIDFVFTRAGEATRTAQNGLLATVPSNFPVVNFDDGDLLGYYSQRAATNVILWSDDFTNAAWVKQGGGTGSVPVVTPNDAIAPDGTLTADRVDFALNGGTSADRTKAKLSQTQTIASPNTSSVWLKTVDGSTKILRLNRSRCGSITLPLRACGNGSSLPERLMRATYRANRLTWRSVGRLIAPRFIYGGRNSKRARKRHRR